MITVWRIALEAGRPPDADGLAILSPEERTRAARFVRDSDRNRWLRAHVATRRVLGEALGVSPAEIRFGVGASGKPFVESTAAGGFGFNLSDSGDVALLALSDVGPVGVDVERIRPLSDLEAIVQSHFAPEEHADLFALPEAERLHGFYRLWSRKEAYIKAIGTGLGHALDRFAVSIAEDDPRIVHVDGDRTEATRWSLRSVAVPSDYVAALAVRSVDAEVLSTDFHGPISS